VNNVGFTQNKNGIFPELYIGQKEYKNKMFCLVTGHFMWKSSNEIHFIEKKGLLWLNNHVEAGESVGILVDRIEYFLKCTKANEVAKNRTYS
jgi:hypothetical protein